MAEHNTKCSYEVGPCIGMQNHSRGSNSTKRAGIFALDNRVVLTDPKFRMFHMGFALRGSPDKRVGKAGVILNFCPWCGADLGEWLAAYEKDIAAHKASLREAKAARCDARDAMTLEVTSEDEKALLDSIRRRSVNGGVKVDALRRLLAQRVRNRSGLLGWSTEVNSLVYKSVPRLLAQWKREGLVDNPVRGTWKWAGRSGARDEQTQGNDR